ncbi:MAG: hypothetical protein IJ696_02210 [Ruminococcus sp.]|nr:hypothetical protein [Ruminococcus sp.]
MKAFSVLFQDYNSPVIIYKGKTVYRYLRCTESGEYVLEFRNVKTNAKHKQFLMFHLLKTNGEIFVNDKRFQIPKTKFPQLSINEDELRNCHSIRFLLLGGHFTMCNGEDTSGDGRFADSLIFGAAITIDRLDDGWFRLNCNDTENDDDFDDFVFDIRVKKNGDVIDMIDDWQPKR